MSRKKKAIRPGSLAFQVLEHTLRSAAANNNVSESAHWGAILCLRIMGIDPWDSGRTTPDGHPYMRDNVKTNAKLRSLRTELENVTKATKGENDA